MAEAAAEEGRRAHLPEQPVHRFGACAGFGRQKGAELLGQVHQDRARLEHPQWLAADAVVGQRGNLGVRVDLDKAAAELVAVTDLDQPGVVFRTAVTKGKQLLKHDADLHAVGRGQGVELQRMLAHRQRLFLPRTGGRGVDAGELATRGRVVGPDFRRYVSAIGHEQSPRVGTGDVQGILRAQTARSKSSRSILVIDGEWFVRDTGLGLGTDAASIDSPFG